MEVKNKLSSHWWWFDNHSNADSRRSPWLQSTLSELDEKTMAILKLIEEDADSFAKRAEMYYKKRPELINLVGDFYRSHRLLAERYDQVKFDSGTRLLAPWASPLSFSKYQTEKSICSVEKSYDSYSENYDMEESVESEVEDPEQEEEVESEFSEVVDEEEVSSGVGNDEVMKLREEINRLEEENRIQTEQLMQKDEEKREAIRQLSFAVDLLKEENVKLKRKIANNYPKKQSPIEFNKLKGVFGKLFNGSPISKASIIPL